MGPIVAQGTISKVVAALGSGSLTPQQAQQQAQQDVEKVQGSVK
jgi:hypothetical protein